MLDYFKRAAGTAKKGLTALTRGYGNMSGLGDYLKQIPAVSQFMNDSKGLYNSGKRLYSGSANQDDLVSAVSSMKNVTQNYKAGKYRA